MVQTPEGAVNESERREAQEAAHNEMLAGRAPWRTEPHDFQGRLDRWCELCNLPDRNPIHKRRTDAEPLTPEEERVLRLSLEGEDDLESRAWARLFATLDAARAERDALARWKERHETAGAWHTRDECDAIKAERDGLRATRRTLFEAQETLRDSTVVVKSAERTPRP